MAEDPAQLARFVVELHRRRIGELVPHGEAVDLHAQPMHLGKPHLLAPQRQLRMRAIGDAGEHPGLAVGAAGLEETARRRRAVERMRTQHHPDQLVAQARHHQQAVGAHQQRRCDEDLLQPRARQARQVGLELRAQQQRQPGQHRDLGGDRRQARAAAGEQQQRQHQHEGRAPARRQHGVGAGEIADDRDQHRRQRQQPVPRIHHAGAQRELAGDQRQHRQRDRQQQHRGRGGGQRRRHTRRRQRPVDQVKPGAGPTVAAHLVKPQQQAERAVHGGHHLVDQGRLLQRVDHAAEKPEHGQVHHQGGDGPGAEAQQFVLEQVEHVVVLRPPGRCGSWPGSR